MSQGILAAVAAAFSAGTVPVFTKALLLDGYSATVILFYRYLWVFAFLGIYFMMRRVKITLSLQQAIELIIFSIIGYGGATFLLAEAFNFMPMGLATMLYFSYPFFVVLIMAIVFREKPSRSKIVALIIAIIGILFLMNFNFNLLNIGSVLALGAGLAYGIYLVCLQKSSLQELDNLVIIFYLGGISSGLFFIKGFITNNNQSFFTLSPKGIIITMLMGMITIFVLQMITFAIAKIGSTQTSLIISFEAVVTLIIGILLFKEPWNINTVLGAILMLVSVIIVSRTYDSDIFLE